MPGRRFLFPGRDQSRAAAADARARAGWHRAEAERIAAGRDEQVETASVEFFAAEPVTYSV